MNWRFWNKAGHDDCAAIGPLLSLYSDDMASPPEVRRIESHLPDCPDCRQTLAWIEATGLAVSRRPALTPPADLRVRIARAIAEAESAKAPVAPAPAAPAPPRPARRPLTLRPALAYGFSLVLFAGVTANVLQHAARPIHTQTAARLKPSSPLTSSPLTSSPLKVAANVPTPETSTSGAVSHVFGQVNATLRSALVVRPTSSPRRLTVHRGMHVPAIVNAPLPTETMPAPPTHLAALPRPQTGPRLSPLPRKTFTAVLHVAAKPPAEHPSLVRKPVIPNPRPDNSQVATANVPAHEEMHTPTAMSPPAPITVRVGPPTVTHDANQVAERAPSLREVLIHAATNMQAVRLSSKATAVNTATSIAVDYSADRSGTVPITYGPIR